MRLAWTLAVALLLPGVALGQVQITFQASTPALTLYRIAPQPGALPEDLSALLDAIATQPGTHAGPITVSPDGNWYVFHSGRFDAGCANSNACLTIAPSSVASAETIAIGGNVIYGEGGVALPGGTAVVYSDGGATHARDLWIVQKQGGVWTGPVLLTGASSFDFNFAPALSPDGTKVIFDAGASSFPSTAVCEVGVDGTGFQVLVTNLDGPPPPYGPSTEAFSGSRAPDASLVFEAEWVSGGGLSERIWRLPAGGGVPALVNGAFANDNSPCVLPDGRIASLYLGAPPPNDNHQIKIMDPDGTNAFALTSSGFIPGFVEVDDVGMGCGPSSGGAPSADLAVAQSDAPDPVSTGGAVSYSVLVTNNGPAAATGVTLTDTLPSGAAFVSSLPGAPTCTASAGILTCGLGGLAAGISTTVTIVVQSGAPGTLTNTAAVAANESDPAAGNNTALETTTVVAGPIGELVHGSSEARDLAALPGPLPAEGLFHIHQAPHASYEIVVDATAADIGSGSGPFLELVEGSTTIQSSVGIGAGSSRSLRFENAAGTALDTRSVRVRSGGCTITCGPESVYRIRAYETTYHVARFNNSGTQTSVLVVQNTSRDAVTGNVWFWDAAGAAVGNQPLSLGPGQALALNTSTIAPNTSGSITLSSDARYGALEGKAVAVEPATGFTFDTPFLPRPR